MTETNRPLLLTTVPTVPDGSLATIHARIAQRQSQHPGSPPQQAETPAQRETRLQLAILPSAGNFRSDRGSNETEPGGMPMANGRSRRGGGRTTGRNEPF